MKRWLLLLPLLAAAPSSTNFTLRTYDFGNGSGAGTSTNYSLQGTAGSPGTTLTSTNYILPVGVKASLTAATPPAPTVTNPSSYYDRLKIVLNVTGFPTDTKYLVAVSPDSFVTTYYVHSNQTIGTTASVSDYQTYAAWGGASGFLASGLTNNTTYQVKVAALQGADTGSGFGPTASAATVDPTVTMSLITSLTSTPPFASSFAMIPGSVATGTATVTVTVSTNAANGGSVQIKDQNAGLTSSSRSYTLTSATADLSSATQGYGTQVTSTSQSSGGPMSSVSPYNVTSNNVGSLTTSFQSLASFATAVTNGSLTMQLLAKSDTAVPVATDYSDVLTLSLSLIF